MTVQAWSILTPTEAEGVVALNGDEIRVEPRAIDNPLSNDLGEGALVGAFVAPARLLDDPDYTAWRPILSGRRIAVLDSATLFLPDDDG